MALAQPAVKQKIAEMSLELAPTTLDEARADYANTLGFWSKRLQQKK